MKQIMLIAISCLFFSMSLQAQDVEGVDICTKMTKDQVIQKFGHPEEYVFKDSYMDEEAKYELYYYGNGDSLVFVNEYLHSFDVYTDRWAVLTYMIDGGIKIGDAFSKLEMLGPKPADWLDTSDEYYIPCGDFPLYISAKDGIITSVSFAIL